MASKYQMQLELENTELRVQNARYEKQRNLWAEEVERLNIESNELKAENARLRAQLEWTPVSQLPTKRGHYWCYIVFEPEVCRRNSRRTWQREAWFDGKNWHSKWGSERIKAWREFPQAWEGESE